MRILERLKGEVRKLIFTLMKRRIVMTLRRIISAISLFLTVIVYCLMLYYKSHIEHLREINALLYALLSTAIMLTLGLLIGFAWNYLFKSEGDGG